MKAIITPGPTGFRIEAEGHLSDAILQAWTWRFFRQHARELGGAAWRREPTFATQHGAAAWLSTVWDWFAVIHPDAGFESGGSAKAMAFASRTQAMLTRHGIAMTLQASGEDIGWTPITFEKRSRWHEEDAWAWQDGPYGLIDELHGMHPRREDESEDEHSERIHAIADTYEAAFVADLEAGQRAGEFQGVAWEFLPLTEYPSDKI